MWRASTLPSGGGTRQARTTVNTGLALLPLSELLVKPPQLRLQPQHASSPCHRIGLFFEQRGHANEIMH